MSMALPETRSCRQIPLVLVYVRHVPAGLLPAAYVTGVDAALNAWGMFLCNIAWKYGASWQPVALIFVRHSWEDTRSVDRFSN